MINFHHTDCMDYKEWNGYLVTVDGHIYSNVSKRFLNPVLMNTGYYAITYKKQTYNIHRLVAELFIDNPNNLPCINHKDGDKLNNCVKNLEWCTYSHNAKHAYDNGLYRNIKPIIATDLKTGKETAFRSAREAEGYGFSNQLISKCCTGKRNYHKGHTFRFV